MRSHTPHWGAVATAAILLAVLAAFMFSTRSAAQDPPVDRFEAIDEYVDGQLDGSNIPGAAIAIVEDGRIVHSRGFGNDGKGHDITAQTPFPIGSLTKSFTALAVMQLVEAGKVELDAPVQRYLPDFRLADAEASKAITVRHLLNQTSGLSRATGIEGVMEQWEVSTAEIVARLRTAELNRPVGESYEYSNSNFVLLGRVVEVVSGLAYADYVEANIFAPLGMDDSYTTWSEARDQGMTAVHQYYFGIARESNAKYLPGFLPTGYLAASADDMARYLAVYLDGGITEDGRVLSGEGIEGMLAGATNTTSRALFSHEFTFQYGRGWFVGPFGAAEDARWHMGELPYFNAWMVLLPETDQAVVVLVNAGSQMEIAGANEVMSRLPRGVVNILRGEEPPTGMGLERFYVMFDAVVLAVVAAQVWSLVRVARSGRAPVFRPRTVREGAATFAATFPLVWEVGLGGLVLLAYPALTGAPWSAAYFAAPDLTIVVAAVAGLWLLTGVVRLARMAQAAHSRRTTAGTVPPGRAVPAP